MSKAVQNNREIGVGTGRNAFAFKPPTSSISNLGNQPNTPDSKAPLRKVRSDIGVQRIALERDKQTDRIQCPEKDSCQLQFNSVDELVDHLVRKIRDRGYKYSWSTDAEPDIPLRKCVLCSHTWDPSYGKKWLLSMLEQCQRIAQTISPLEGRNDNTNVELARERSNDHKTWSDMFRVSTWEMGKSWAMRSK